MPGSTPTYGFPYPTGTDRVQDGDNAIAALAQAVEDEIDAGAVPGGELAYAQVTANQGPITGDVDLTGLSVTVDVAAGRRIRISGEANMQSSVVNDRLGLEIAEGAVQMQAARQRAVIANDSVRLLGSITLTPTAGAHTYKLMGGRLSGTGSVTMVAGPTNPALIQVEDLGLA
jgi:hypothetical protein